MIAAETPFRHWIIDGFCTPMAWHDLPPRNWVGWEARYDNDQERGKYTTRRALALPDEIRHVAADLHSAKAVAEWSGRMGIDLWPDPAGWGGGFHVTAPGGFLQVHLDWAIRPQLTHQERRLTLIAYLHPEWRPEWGGRLVLANPSGNAVVKIDPLPGRLVAFENSDLSYHGGERVTDDAKPRISFMACMLAKTRPSATRHRAVYLPNRNSPYCPAEVS